MLPYKFKHFLTYVPGTLLHSAELIKLMIPEGSVRNLSILFIHSVAFLRLSFCVNMNYNSRILSDSFKMVAKISEI